MQKELPRPDVFARKMESFARRLNRRSLFAKSSDVPRLSSLLYKVWSGTLDKSNGRDWSEGKPGLKSAHQHAVDGFITLVRLKMPREEILSTVEKVASEEDLKRFTEFFRKIG